MQNTVQLLRQSKEKRRGTKPPDMKDISQRRRKSPEHKGKTFRTLLEFCRENFHSESLKVHSANIPGNRSFRALCPKVIFKEMNYAEGK